MTRNEALEILRREKPRLIERYGIERIGLFGSTARDEARPDSDVDVLVDVSVTNTWEYLRLIEEINAAFLGRVDVVRYGPHLRPQFRERLERDVMYV